MSGKSTPFHEAHWSRDPFVYKGFSAYWDEDHPAEYFWVEPKLAETKYSTLIESGVLEKWDEMDEEELNLDDLDEEADAEILEVLEFRRSHYQIELEDLIIKLDASNGESIEGVAREEVFIWAGLDPKDVIQSSKYQFIPV